MIEFSGGRRPMIESAVTLLPEPDSPTSATVLSSGMSKETPRTASKTSSPPSRKLTRRSRTAMIGSPAVGFVSVRMVSAP